MDKNEARVWHHALFAIMIVLLAIIGGITYYNVIRNQNVAEYERQRIEARRECVGMLDAHKCERLYE